MTRKSATIPAGRLFPLTSRLLPAVAAAAALSGCAAFGGGEEEPETLADRAQAESRLYGEIGEDWEKGEKRIARGEDLIEEGRDDLEEGREKIEKGREYIAEGRRLQQRAEARYERETATRSESD